MDAPLHPTLSPPAAAAAPSARTVTFAYRAQTGDGDRMTGTIEATDAQGAMERLQAMRLRVTELSPAGGGGDVPAGDNGQAAAEARVGNERRAGKAKAGRPLRGD